MEPNRPDPRVKTAIFDAIEATAMDADNCAMQGGRVFFDGDFDLAAVALAAARPTADIVAAATDLVALWGAQRITNLPRADRNAAIEETRERLIRAVEAYDDRLEQSGAATPKAA